MLILLVEDHRLLAQNLIDYLSYEDIEVDYAADGLQGLALATKQAYDAIVLDVMLPSLDGFQICANLRNEQQIDTPILMLTARDQLDDKLQGFDTGADDYLVKPFEQAELVARLKSLVKRHRAEVVAAQLCVGDLTLDTGSHRVWRAGKSLLLSPIGFSLLQALMRASPRVLGRDQIHRLLWADEPPDTDALRSHVYNLRKVVDHPFEHAMIKTVKGVGLQLLP